MGDGFYTVDKPNAGLATFRPITIKLTFFRLVAVRSDQICGCLQKKSAFQWLPNGFSVTQTNVKCAVCFVSAGLPAKKKTKKQHGALILLPDQTKHLASGSRWCIREKKKPKEKNWENNRLCAIACNMFYFLNIDLKSKSLSPTPIDMVTDISIANQSKNIVFFMPQLRQLTSDYCNVPKPSAAAHARQSAHCARRRTQRQQQQQEINVGGCRVRLRGRRTAVLCCHTLYKCALLFYFISIVTNV